MRLPQLIGAIALAFAATAGSALEIRPYTAELLAAAQAAGKPVALHFHADWCPVCRAQEEVFDALEADAEFGMTLLVADYDKERDLKRRLNVARQSTLIVYRGGVEKARITGEKSAAKLKAALRAALR